MQVRCILRSIAARLKSPVGPAPQGNIQMNRETMTATAPVAPNPEALARADKFFADHRIEFVLAQFVDIHGVAKTKAVPVSHFKDILTTGAGFAGGGVWGLGIKPHEAEYILVGDINTLTLAS